MTTALKDKIIPCIEASYTDPLFNVNALIENLDISAGYLGEITLRHFGFSPRILIETVRLDKTIEFLDTSVSLVIISSCYGFGNYKTFRSAFERRIGISPAIARKQLQDSQEKADIIKKWKKILWNSKTA